MLKALEPYTSTIKMGLLAAGIITVFSLGSWAGCTVGKNNSQDTINKLNADNTVLTAQLSVVSAAVEESNKQVEANKQFAKEREKLAAEAADEAEKAKTKLAAKEKELAKKLKDAAKIPDCKTLMEMQLCPQLRDY